MSVLNTAARSAYRQLYRASRTTFSGDEPVLQAFRGKMRDDVYAIKIQDGPLALQQYTDTALEVAQFLRRNVLQAAKAEGGEEELWKLRVTKDTELGDNDSVKSPPLPESSRQARRRAKAENLSDAVPLNPSIPRPRLNFSVLKKAHKQRVVPELNEDDIKEIFVRGSGPGGQSINKTENNVQLIHKPTNLRVSCQDTRSLEQNRKLARRLLVEKLDKIYNPGLSKEQFKQARQQERERRRRKKAKKRALTKAEILEAE